MGDINIFFLLEAIVSFALILFFIIQFFKTFSRPDGSKASSWLFLLSFGYLIFFLLSLAWMFAYFPYDSGDLLFLSFILVPILAGVLASMTWLISSADGFVKVKNNLVPVSITLTILGTAALLLAMMIA